MLATGASKLILALWTLTGLGAPVVTIRSVLAGPETGAPSALFAERSVEQDAELESVLVRAGANRSEIERALRDAPRTQRDGIEFLVRSMPEHDLRSLSADVLLEETDLAYRASNESAWGGRIPEDVFLNDVLPYAVVSEVRVPWRRFLRARVSPWVEGCRTPGEAAVRLNQQIYAQFGVRYSTERSRTDQNAMQAIDEGRATCTGLSVLLISACRSVGVPARLVGTPLWADSSGNHSWVEVWDDGWHFTGAAEPTGDRLDEGWFVDRASRALPDVPVHSIYATHWSRTGTTFPLAWDEDGSLGYVNAVDVTRRYAGTAPSPPGMARVGFVLRDGTGRRLAASFEVIPHSGARSARTETTHASGGGNRSVPVFRGETKDDSVDGNDHVSTLLRAGQWYVAKVEGMVGQVQREFQAQDGVLVELFGKARGEELRARHDSSASDSFRPAWGRPGH